MGELKKLEIQLPSRNTVKNILKAQGLDPEPDRGSGSWDFLILGYRLMQRGRGERTRAMLLGIYGCMMRPSNEPRRE
jgi:hypothetical protein